MFFASGVGGSEQFRRIFDQFHIDSTVRRRRVAKFLGVSESTLSRWLSGYREPPLTAVRLLWHESHEGRAVTSAHSEHGALLLRQLSESLRSENNRLRRAIDTLLMELDRAKQTAATPQPSNDPMYEPGRSRVRE